MPIRWPTSRCRSPDMSFGVVEARRDGNGRRSGRPAGEGDDWQAPTRSRAIGRGDDGTGRRHVRVDVGTGHVVTRFSRTCSGADGHQRRHQSGTPRGVRLERSRSTRCRCGHARHDGAEGYTISTGSWPRWCTWWCWRWSRSPWCGIVVCRGSRGSTWAARFFGMPSVRADDHPVGRCACAPELTHVLEMAAPFRRMAVRGHSARLCSMLLRTKVDAWSGRGAMFAASLRWCWWPGAGDGGGAGLGYLVVYRHDRALDAGRAQVGAGAAHRRTAAGLRNRERGGRLSPGRSSSRPMLISPPTDRQYGTCRRRRHQRRVLGRQQCGSCRGA